MLTITALGDAEYLLRQVAFGVEDYYMGAGEAPGVWQGRLAAELQLVGVVEPDQLRALLGRDLATDAELLSTGRPWKVTAFDVTFSAPKSVSLLWAFGSPEVVAAAAIAHVEAVTAALDFLERRAGATRQQIDGYREQIQTGLAVATFVHRTSREGDPQLHTHCVVVNVGRRPDGTYAALDAPPSISGAGRPAPSTRRSCAAASPGSSGWSGARKSTDAGRWRASTPDGCGRSPSARSPSTITWPAPARRTPTRDSG